MVHMELDFSPEADDAWAAIVERDQPQAPALDAVFDQLECDPASLRSIQYDVDPTARLTVVQVPGRNEPSWVIWRDQGDGTLRIEHVGRLHL